MGQCSADDAGTELIRVRLTRRVFITIPIDAPWSVDENTPIGIVGGVGVDSIRIAKVGKGLVGAGQQLVFQVLKA